MRILLFSVLAVLAAGCSKPDTDTKPPAPPAEAPSAPPVVSASGSASLPAPPSPPPSSANAASSATTNVAPTGKPAPVAAVTADAGPTCGKKPLPECPLQGWMKANTAPAMASSDMPALAIALDRIATFAPPGYTNWVSISKDGARAAREAQLDAVKASCRSCHEQYKSKYKAELRPRPLP